MHVFNTTTWLIISGLVLGGVFGYSLERSGFCMNSAFRSILFEKDKSILRSWILALLIAAVGVAILESAYIIFPLRSPFYPLAILPGSFIFGIGMVFAGGCVSGTYYRSGRGMLGSMGALFGFVFGATLLSNGPLKPFNRLLKSFEWTIAGEEPGLYHILPNNTFVGKWVVLGVLVIAGGIFLIKAPKEEFVLGWSWKLTGVVMGVIALVAWVVSGFYLRDYGLSFTQPSVSWARYLFAADKGGINWASWLVLGVLGGATLGSIIHGDFALRLPTAERLVQQVGGGLFMGFGATAAGGCNIGHGLTGLSALSLASLVATVFTMFGVWAATAFVFANERTKLKK